MFGQVDANGNPNGNNEVATTATATSCVPGWSSNQGSGAKASKLGFNGKKVGPNMMLKVMAGDNIAVRTDYYYTGPIDNSGQNGMLSNVLTSMLSALSYNTVTSSLHGSSTAITSNINANPLSFGDFLN